MRKFNKRFTAVMLFLVLFLACFLSIAGLTDSASYAATNNNLTEHDERALIEAAREMRRSGMAQFNFTDLDLVMFVRFASELMQRTIVVPPNVTGRVTVTSPRPNSLQEARQIFIAILQTHGWTLQNMGGYDRLVQGVIPPSPVPGPIPGGLMGPGQGEEVVTHIISLRFIVAEMVANAMQHAFGHNVLVLPLGNGRDIILQGRATDVSRGVEVIRRLDQESSASRSRVLMLQHADPALVANQLNVIAQQGGHLRGLSAIPDQGSRQVVLVGEERVIGEAMRIVAQLDVDMRESEFHIHRLQHIDATAAAEQIGRVLAASAMGIVDGHLIPATVVPDVTTNSLIFTATQRQFDSLRNVLEAIDFPARQVLIRGFMAEINVTNLERAGIDWAIMGGQIWDNFMLGGAGQLGEGMIPPQFLQWFGDLSRQEVPGWRDTDGRYHPATVNYRPLALLYATVEMLRGYDAINVLSMPRLMGTDGRESSFQVGQVIPVMTGTASDLANPGALHQQFSYRDTGLTLTVTPHIRSGNVVALDIEQTTEDVLTAMGSLTPVTAKRQVRTSVTVQNGETVILGGMIRETDRFLRRGVPGLSAIPLIGNLFRRVAREREKIDFIIFLTPEIIETPDQMRVATERAVGTIGDPEQFRMGFSPVETDIDRRFQALYEQSLRNRR